TGHVYRPTAGGADGEPRPAVGAHVVAEQVIDGRRFLFDGDTDDTGAYDIEMLVGSADVKASFHDESHSHAGLAIPVDGAVQDFSMTTPEPYILPVDLETR